jgi:hypothetical protein
MLIIKKKKVDKSKYELKLLGLNNAIKIREEWSESVIIGITSFT